ncbi:MAG: hypothetical protein ACRDL6_08490 [Solirubrobacterales bacterium]
MRARWLIMIMVAAVAAFSVMAGTASAAVVDYPRDPAPAWFTEDFKQRVDTSGPEGVPLDEHSALDVCPGVVLHEGGVGTGTCLVFPFGCTANFVYHNGGGSTAPAVANGSLYLGTAGHCVERAGEPVYGAVSTPGVGASIVRIGTVSKLIEEYDDDGLVRDFASIKVEDGLNVFPDSPVGGPQGIYDGCDPGQPLKYYGHGYEVAVGQGKPGGGVAAHWYQDGYGYLGTAFGGDSGSGVLHADDRAAGDLTAIIILDPSLAYAPGEVVGTRVTWILGFLGSGYSLVNQDGTLASDTTTACASGGSGDGGTGGGKGGGKGGGPKNGGQGGGKGGGNGRGKPA